MHIEEAYGLQEWVNEQVVKSNVQGRLNELKAVIDQQATQPNQPRKPFEEQRANFIAAAQQIDLSSLTLAQVRALEKLGVYENIGPQGVEKLEQILNNTVDIAHVNQRIGEMLNQLNQGLKNISTIHGAVGPLIDEEGEEIPADQAIARVIFDHDASITDIAKLRHWSNVLFNIGRGFAMAKGKAPQDFKIVSAAKGSLVFEIAAAVTLLVPLSAAIKNIMESLVKYRDFQLKGEELRAMKNKYPDEAAQFEKDAAQWDARAKDVLDTISVTVSEEAKLTIEGFPKSASKELEKAVTELTSFYAKGGTVDCVLPPDEEEGESEEVNENETSQAIKQLREDFARIRELRKVVQIEHLPHLDDVEDEEEDENQ